MFHSTNTSATAPHRSPFPAFPRGNSSRKRNSSRTPMRMRPTAAAVSEDMPVPENRAVRIPAAIKETRIIRIPNTTGCFTEKSFISEGSFQSTAGLQPFQLKIRGGGESVSALRMVHRPQDGFAHHVCGQGAHQILIGGHISHGHGVDAVPVGTGVYRTDGPGISVMGHAGDLQFLFFHFLFLILYF